MTDELAAARFKNLYEFGLNKERWWREAQKMVRPWTLQGGVLNDP